MIVIGVDVHKHSLSAVAVDELGRQLDAVETSDDEELLAWSKRVSRRRLTRFLNVACGLTFQRCVAAAFPRPSSVT